MKIVITGNYAQYLRYLEETNRTPKEAKYCWWLEDIMGYHDVEIVRYGEYWKNPLYNDDHLKAIEQSPEKYKCGERFPVVVRCRN